MPQHSIEGLSSGLFRQISGSYVLGWKLTSQLNPKLVLLAAPKHLFGLLTSLGEQLSFFPSNFSLLLISLTSVEVAN